MVNFTHELYSRDTNRLVYMYDLSTKSVYHLNKEIAARNLRIPALESLGIIAVEININLENE